MSVALILSLLNIAAGFVLLYFGGRMLVERAKILALGLGVPLAVVGVTVVSLGTTFPEIVVGVLATVEGSPSLALGNVIGSTLANIGLVIGLAVVISPPRDLKWGRTDGLAFVLSPLLLVALAFDGVLGRADGVVLLLAALAHFTAAAVSAHPSGLRSLFSGHAEARQARRQMALAVLGIAVSIALLVAGGQTLVASASFLARAAGVSELVIGLTIIAIGTSLPEIFTSITSARRGVPELAVANATGSNIINLLVVAGLASAVSPITVPASIWRLDLPLLVAATTFLVVWIAYRPRLGRAVGVGLLAGYAAYLVTLFLRG